MKKFTCSEMGGVCEESFEGETPEEVGNKGGEHIMSSSDEVHAPMRDKMNQSSEDDKKQWWDWFGKLWHGKSEQ